MVLAVQMEKQQVEIALDGSYEITVVSLSKNFLAPLKTNTKLRTAPLNASERLVDLENID